MGTVERYREDWPREDWTVTNRHGIGVYVDGDRLCPAATSIIEQMMRRGKLNPPIYGTDGYERRAENPELIFWYARRLGELAHDRIAARVDETYDRDTQGIVRRIRRLDGLPEDVEELDVIGELYRYRDANVRSDLVHQAEKDVGALMTAWEEWRSAFSWVVPFRAEYGMLREHTQWDDVAWGLRPDLLAYDSGEVVAVCIKTGSRITDAHRMQGIVTYHSSMDIDGVEIVRLDREREWYKRETVDPQGDRYMCLYADYLDASVRVFRSIN
ncbi:hypothetical protein J2754_001559 [Halarchaeum solikamskense]|uniref:hypothetical protein n=1 Tax=Halarchaeum nitratireducens TaxID=489913 RepID=UPI001B3AF196|nr:hypothetical protein [Halarchaeum solikamskense]MBP2251238.1 hypothetical protein [Halarchaeum solikamskense]